ncbi:MAG: iron-containing alcohol dehydrogenase, partial [Desulfuromonadales bacterium]|nr:iron-containing alcohol dehydrogenase [Desulfuromonadales bacterium]
RMFKMSIKGPQMFPAVALVDPDLLATLPPPLVASTGMDALTHAIEAYVSNLSNPYSDGLALQAIRLISENLPRAYKDGSDMEARSNMCYGQYCAGLAFNSSQLGNTHSLAHALGAIYNLPHGECNALMLPYVMRKNMPAVSRKMAEIAQILGADGSGLSEEQFAEQAVVLIEQFNRNLGLASSIKELAGRYGKQPDAADIQAMVEHAVQDPCNKPNPVPFSAEDYRTIFEKAWKA